VAHPPSAIAVGEQRQVFYTDGQEGVFSLKEGGRAVRINPKAMHWMALDRRGGFAEAPDEFGEWFGRITPRGERPALVSCSDFPCTIGRDGNIYFAKMHGLAIMRRTPRDDESVFVDADDYGLDLSRAWGVSGMTSAPDGEIYLVALDSDRTEGTGEHMLYGVNPNGELRQIARNFANDQVSDNDQHPEVRPQYCRGMAADDHGNVFIAVTGSRCVMRITSTGEASVVLRAARPWSPTGVDVAGDSLYVLEFDDETPAKGREWPLRVRKVDGDGAVSLLVSVRAG
jgi:hypothetical protein